MNHGNTACTKDRGQNSISLSMHKGIQKHVEVLIIAEGPRQFLNVTEPLGVEPDMEVSFHVAHDCQQDEELMRQ